MLGTDFRFSIPLLSYGAISEILECFSAARGRLRVESKKGPRHANLHDLNIHVPKFHQDRITSARARAVTDRQTSTALRVEPPRD